MKKTINVFLGIIFLIFINRIDVLGDDYAHKKVMVITDAPFIMCNTKIEEICKEKNILFEYMGNLEKHEEVLRDIYENDIEEIVYMFYGKRKIDKFITGLNEEINIREYRIVDYTVVNDIVSRLEYVDRIPNEDLTINVVNRNEITKYWMYESPNYRGNKVGYVYGNLAEIKILKEEGEFYKIEFTRYSDKKRVHGYIPKKDVAKRRINSDYRVIVSIDEQRVKVYKNGVLERSIICSTGLGGNYTPKGRFIIGSRGPSFGDLYSYTCYNWVRFNNNYLFHSVLFRKDGNINKTEEKKLGTPASHGCIRMPLEDSEWFYKNVTSGTLVEII